jgi:copper(I)-binding protein
MGLSIRLIPHILFSVLLAACAQPAGIASQAGAVPQIEIVDPWIKAYGAMLTIAGQAGASTPSPTRASDAQHAAPMDTAVYLTIHNAGQADRLIGATCDLAGQVELHEMENQDGVLTMRRVPGMAVPAGGNLILKPDGSHIMLLDLKRDPRLGEVLDVTLQFERAGTVPVRAEVRRPPGG